MWEVKFIERHNIVELQGEVNDACAFGWEPIGITGTRVMMRRQTVTPIELNEAFGMSAEVCH